LSAAGCHTGLDGAALPCENISRSFSFKDGETLRGYNTVSTFDEYERVKKLEDKKSSFSIE
jgi:hypothetical protein